MRHRIAALATVVLLVSGGVAATAATPPGALPPATAHDVAALAAAESGVVAQLRAYPRAGKTEPVAVWEARLKTAEATQAAAQKALAADLAGAEATKGALAATSTSVTSQVGDLSDSSVTVSVITTGTRLGAARPGTITAAITDHGKTLGTWKAGAYSSAEGGPYLSFEVDYGSPNDTLTRDAGLSNTTWSGPASFSVPAKDFLDGYALVSASYAGQPGFAPSKSSAVALG